MTNAEHDDRLRASRRRKQAVGVVGVAAILGGGAFLVTDQLTDSADTVVNDTGALAPLQSAAAPVSVTPSVPATTPGKVVAAPSKAPSSADPTPKTSAQRIAAARAAAEAGKPVRRPIPPENGGAVAAAEDVTVTNSGSLKDGGTMRVVSAMQDLSGQRELRWAADDGEVVGDARCTQNFVFSSGSPAKERPTMLLCWRTSDARSVITVAVSASGRPSKAISVAELDERWAKLG